MVCLTKRIWHQTIFDNPLNHSFHFTAEFTCKNGQDEFRPDITLFVNGLPLCFVEVKKPNNHGGMVAESKRMNLERFPNRKFRRFINITQLMIFSNNMEYDTMGGIVLIQGALYCTAARESAPFNCFHKDVFCIIRFFSWLRHCVTQKSSSKSLAIFWCLAISMVWVYPPLVQR